MRLFVAEKKSLAKAIADQIGIKKNETGYFECEDDTKVTWALGHLLELASPSAYISEDCPRMKNGEAIWRMEDLPIVPEEWVSKPIKDKKAQLAIIGKLLKKAKTVVNAGDPDREGQALVDNVLEYHKNKKPVMRIWVNANDPKTIQRGLDNMVPNEEYEGWKNASIARSRADWLIGMNLTRALSLTAKEHRINSLLVVGRVQSPTLQIVVERDRAIENFKPVKHYTVLLFLKHSDTEFKAEWVIGEDTPGLDENDRLVNPQAAMELIENINKPNTTARVVSFESKLKEEKPKLCYSLAQISLIAANKHGHSAEDVLKACQSLYEKKLLSYPRTDNSYIPDEQYDDRTAIIENLKAVFPQRPEIFTGVDTDIKSKAFNSKKTSAHHAIIPTEVQAPFGELSPIEQHIYEFVALNYISQFMKPESYKAVSLVLSCQGETFKCNGRFVVDPGWKAIYVNANDNKPKNESPEVPEIQEGTDVPVISVKGDERKTKPPIRFNEGSLIAAMENVHKYVDNADVKRILKDGLGIGTPATRATLISELKRREYLKADGKFIVSTQFGRALADNIPEDMKSAALTAMFESKLTEIQDNGASADEFVQEQTDLITNIMKDIVIDAEKLRPFSKAAPTKKKGKKRSASKKRSAKVS